MLISFLEHRIGDKRILCLIQKWLKVGGTGRRDRDGQWDGDGTGSGDHAPYTKGNLSCHSGLAVCNRLAADPARLECYGES